MKKVLSSILLGFSLLFSINISKIYAEEINYTSVLEDLKKDSLFNESKYVKRNFETVYEINNDNIDTNDIPYIEVIGIAEGFRNELFIYTYQPCNENFDLNITSVNLMDDFSSNGDTKEAKLYTLELISEESVFNKYKVENYTITSCEERYYNIVALYAFNNGLEDGLVGGDKNEVGLPIGQQWCAYDSNGSIVYEMNTFDIVELDITTAGFIHMKNGLTLDNLVLRTEALDAHYIGFTCENFEIKHVYDADLNYHLTKYIEEQYLLGTDTYTQDLGTHSFTITDEQEVNFQGKGLFAKTMDWSRILPSSEYISNLEAQGATFSDESKQEILSCDYIFSYLETEYKQYVYDLTQTNVEYSRTSNVTLLRLHFMDIHDNVYNLGVVADKVTEDNISDGVASEITPEDIWSRIQEVMNSITNGVSLFMLIIRGFSICVVIGLLIYLLILLLKIIPIHKWIANLIVAPFPKKRKKKKEKLT